jgi:uncharacterized protein (TIGR02001 family)
LHISIVINIFYKELIMKKTSLHLTTLALAGLLGMNMASAQMAPAAAAKAPAPDYTVSYNIGAVSDYRFRGISQTSKGAAVQGGADVAFKNGAYLGAWASNVRWVRSYNGASKGNLEVDLYGGYKGEIAKDVGFDVGAIAYMYPGNNSGAAGTLGFGSVDNADTKEIYGAVTSGIFTAKYSRSMGTFLGFKNSSGSSYIDLSAAVDLGDGFTLTPHVGYQKIAGTTPGASASNHALFGYTDYALTLAKDMGAGLTLTAAATSTNAKSVNYTEFAQFGGKVISKEAFFVGAKYSF